MKNVLILLLCFASVSIAFGQTALADGDNCFDNGDYNCAVLKYREAMDIATGRDKQMAEIKLTRAQSCSEWLTNANRAFNSRDYKVAKENYELVIEENPNDIFAKLQLEKTIEALKVVNTLTVSKIDLRLSADDALEIFNVTTNASNYQITHLPTWCRVVNKQANWFSLEIRENKSGSSRTDWFKVTAGDKEVRINITQSAVSNKAVTQRTTSPNQNVQRETPPPIVYPKKPEKVKREKRAKNSYNSFFAVGYEGGEIANYGIRVEFGGTRFVGMFLNVRSSFTSDRDIIDSYRWFDNKNEAVLGVNLKVTRSVFINLGGGYGFYKYRGFDNTLEQIDYYPAYGGLTFRLGRRINLSGGASFEDIEQSFNTNVFRPEYTVGLTINLRK